MRVDGLQAVGVLEIETERQPCQIEVGQIFDGGMLVEIVGVVKHGYGKVGRVAEGAAYGETGGRSRVEASGGGETIESPKIESSIRLKLVDSFWQV